VLLDEAHHIVEAINQVYCVTVSASMLSQCTAQLQRYEEKYRLRLRAKNIVRSSSRHLVIISLCFLDRED
jgi:hypothetical protein